MKVKRDEVADYSTGLTLSRLLTVLRRAWPVLIVSLVLGAGGAYVAAERQTPLYDASASVYFSLNQGGSGSDLNQGSAYTQAQILSFATLATSSITLDRVIDELNLDITSRDLARNITVRNPQNTVILDISVSSRSPDRAASIANSVASNLSSVVVELAPTANNQDAAVAARVIEPAVRPNVQSSPDTSRDTALGGVLGLLVGAIGCVLFTLLDTRVRSAEIANRVAGLPTLGQIGRVPKNADNRPIMVREPNSVDAEAFRHLRAALAFTSVDRELKAILITSGSPGEGKTTLAVNLALAVAESGARVLLIDADLRRPQVAATLEVEGAIGLTTMIVGAVSAGDAVRRYGATNLDLLLSGDIPPNPAELLASHTVAQVITDFTALYDFVIVDTAPVLSVADASLLSPHVDLTLVVVDASKTRNTQLERTMQSLRTAGAMMSGVVLNRARISKKRDVYHYGPALDRGGDKIARLTRTGQEAAATVEERISTNSSAQPSSRALITSPTETADSPSDMRAGRRDEELDSGRRSNEVLKGDDGNLSQDLRSEEVGEDFVQGAGALGRDPDGEEHRKSKTSPIKVRGRQPVSRFADDLRVDGGASSSESDGAAEATSDSKPRVVRVAKRSAKSSNERD